MSPIQQMLLGVGAVDTKTFVDDIFNIDVYVGDGFHPTLNTGGTTSRNIVNGIDFTQGGLAIFKRRDSQSWWQFVDTENGATNALVSNTNAALDTNRPNGLKTFNNNGFTIGYDGLYNQGALGGGKYVATSFRKAPGFFTIKEYSGTGSVQSISHDLGSIPGMILIKRTDASGHDWVVYHRSLNNMAHLNSGTSQERGYLKLNETDGVSYTSRLGLRPSQDPTATTFHVKNQSNVNASGGTYIAYIFAGGESDVATAHSVYFDSNGEYLEIGDSNDFDFGSTFTFEAWVKPDFSSDDFYQIFYAQGTFDISISKNGSFIFDSNHNFVGGDTQSSSGSVPEGQWTHVAAVCTSGTLKLYVNGVHNQNTARTGVNVTGVSGNVKIGRPNNSGRFTGHISNLRIVKGTAVYTSSFRPPYEPLTNITNTKLLCCNDSSTTGSTVTPNTITANGSPTASRDIPFDDPAGFVFGESGSENVIKCGSFVGNGSSPTSVTGPNVFVGFEPQWLMIKSAQDYSNNATAVGAWTMFDSMRGAVTGGNDQYLFADSDFGSTGTTEYIEFNSTGFRLVGGGGNWNNNHEYIYIACRRPDGYVGKPPELGTDVFAMDTGASSSTIPNFDSGFPVDWAFQKKYTGSEDWYLSARLIQGKYLFTNTNEAESSSGNMVFDSNAGWALDSNSNYQSWMWKRHAGFDVVAYSGVGGGQTLNHQLSKIPEMIWIKNRTYSSGEPWTVGHKGLNGGTNPWEYWLQLNNTDPEYDSSSLWNDTAPTATQFTVGSNRQVDFAANNYIAMLFASVDGISKVGSFSGSNSTVSVNLGFQPRFLILKRASGTGNWVVLDTVRGWGAGDDQYLRLNATSQNAAHDVGAPTSTGFDVTGGSSDYNSAGSTYIYYAHA